MAAFEGFSNIGKVPELRRRIIFTLAIVAIYRVGVFITTPGVDRGVMRSIVSGQGGLLGLFNLFSGGALENLSIFALGIMPYVSASIIMQLMGLVSKQVEELRKEGEAGRRKLEQWTRYGTILLSIFQSFGVAMMLEGMNNADMGGGRFGDVVADPGWNFRLMTIITLTTGTGLLMWLGEQATERGIGNGTSMIILASIVSGVPSGVTNYVAAGIGNIYACEALHVAGLSPFRQARTLATSAGSPRPTTIRLVRAIKQVLTRAIAAETRPARSSRFRVYDREGEPCRRTGCGGIIRRRTQAGRSTFYCPKCQR